MHQLYRIRINQRHVGLICLVIVLTAGFSQPSFGQSGVGVGLVYSGPNVGGLSVRFKSFQALFSSVGATDDRFMIRSALRYNHTMNEWNRLRLNAYGQAGLNSFLTDSGGPESGTAAQYRFTAGASVDFRLGRHKVNKGLVLSADIGLSMNHKGDFGRVPALGIGLHYFF